MRMGRRNFEELRGGQDEVEIMAIMVVFFSVGGARDESMIFLQSWVSILLCFGRLSCQLSIR
jgi:hypothetical protein